MLKLSIVIATYNRLSLLVQTLYTIRENTDNDYEIVVVDDASSDGTKEYLMREAGIKSYRFEERKYVAEVKAKGYELTAPSEYVYFSDNDVYLLPHWDTTLIKALENNPDVGIIGGRRHPHHKVLEVRKNGDIDIFMEETQSGYSLMMRRGDYIKTGGFKKMGKKEAGEDCRMCEMVANMGLKIAAVSPPVLHHCGMLNYSGSNASDYPEMVAESLEHPEILFK